jgi:hypothetical protein
LNPAKPYRVDTSRSLQVGGFFASVQEMKMGGDHDWEEIYTSVLQVLIFP